jgi:hypothetical protein
MTTIFFHDSDYTKLAFNSVNLNSATGGTRKKIGAGYSTTSVTALAGYNEMTSAPCGGTIVGYGPCRAPQAAVKGERGVLNQVAKSFAHSIGVNALQRCTGDTIAPRFESSYTCGHWSDTTADDFADQPMSGISDIFLLADSSMNATFTSASFHPGDQRVPFTVDVVSLLREARAVVVAHDGAGNESSTTLHYAPPSITSAPDSVDFGFVHRGDTVRSCITLTNIGDSVATLSGFKLRFAAAISGFTMDPPPAGNRITLAPHESATICLRWVAPDSSVLLCRDDTLYATSCTQFVLATAHGCNSAPAISVDDWCLEAATPVGDTATGSLTLQSVGSDTLHVRALEFRGDDASDFRIDYERIVPAQFDYDPALDPRGAWTLPVGSRVTLPVVFQPSSPAPNRLREATLYLTDDADGVFKDTAFVCGIALPLGVEDEPIAPRPTPRVEIFPLPAATADVVTVQIVSPGFAGARATLRLIDMLGRVVAARRMLIDADGRARFDLGSDVGNGVYAIEVSTAVGSTTARYVVER